MEQSENVYLTPAELHTVLYGGDLEVTKAEMKLKAEIELEAKLWLDKPTQEWPPFDFNWDLRPENWVRALDGEKDSQWDEHFPEGLKVAWVKVAELQSRLNRHNRRSKAQIWEVGNKGKLANVLAYSARGLPITPPVVAVVKASDRSTPTAQDLFLIGGNHRWAAAYGSGCEEIPILVEPKYVSKIEQMIELRWETTDPEPALEDSTKSA